MLDKLWKLRISKKKKNEYQTAFVSGAFIQKEIIIEKACNLYLKELIQFNNLLVRLNPEYDKLIDVNKSYDDFKKKLEE